MHSPFRAVLKALETKVCTPVEAGPCGDQKAETLRDFRESRAPPMHITIALYLTKNHEF